MESQPGCAAVPGCVRVAAAQPAAGRASAAAPVGASVVILFVQFHSPLAQPWPLLGSYLIATATGLACSHWVTQPILAAALAVALTIWLMAWLNCVHPPGARWRCCWCSTAVFQRRHGGGG